MDTLMSGQEISGQDQRRKDHLHKMSAHLQDPRCLYSSALALYCDQRAEWNVASKHFSWHTPLKTLTETETYSSSRPACAL